MRLREPVTRAPEAWVQRDDTTWSATYHVEVVTPLFGGGVEAGTPDPAWPVRATAIRGQLRFWWRILEEGGEQHLAGRKLFEAERRLWGGLGKEPVASRVRVGVERPNDPVETVACRDLLERYREDRQGPIAYALFPGLEGDNTQKEMVVVGPLTITLRVSAPAEHRETVEETLRWWASFGGVGGRTRRGLGTVRVARERDGALLEPVTVEEAAARGCTLIQRRAQKGAVRAWTAAVGRLRAFRQGTNDREGRNPGQGNRPGRSRWPEADSIRAIAGSDRTADHPARNAFPRAAFGMPIIFHFQRSNHEGRPPRDHTLQPVGPDGPDGPERLASPLILKAQAVEGGFAPVALLLPRDHVDRLNLKLMGSHAAERATAELAVGRWWQEAKAAQVAPMKGRGSGALSAFMAFFKEGA